MLWIWMHIKVERSKVYVNRCSFFETVMNLFLHWQYDFY